MNLNLHMYFKCNLRFFCLTHAIYMHIFEFYELCNPTVNVTIPRFTILLPLNDYM